MRIARETWIISALGLADLISTIVFIQNNGAQEANPIFQHYWQMGLPNFILAKVVLMACPLMILEWARRHKPRLARHALRTVIVGYVMLYGIGFVKLNVEQAHADEIARMDSSEMYPPLTKQEVHQMLERFHAEQRLEKAAQEKTVNN